MKTTDELYRLRAELIRHTANYPDDLPTLLRMRDACQREWMRVEEARRRGYGFAGAASSVSA